MMMSRALCLILCAGCATAGGGVSDGIDSGNGGGPDGGGGGQPDARTGGGGDGGGGMIDAGGGGTPDAMVAAMCTLVPQSGCTGGDACDLSCATTCTTDCRPVTVPGTDTDTCSSGTGCAPGYVCLGPAAKSSCFEYCTLDSQCTTGAGAICVIQIVFGTPPVDVVIDGTPVKVCSRSCQPVGGAGCPATWGCHVYQENTGAMRFFTECTAPGPGGQGAACTTDEDCQAGWSCINDGTSNLCAKNCRRSPPPPTSDCAGVGTTTCVGFTTPPIIAGQEYGVCL